MFNQLPPKPGLSSLLSNTQPMPAGQLPPGNAAPAVTIGIGPNQKGADLGKHLGVIDATRGGGKKPDSKSKR